MYKKNSSPGRTGFTLIELLVVIAIIAVLIGLLLPAVQKVRDAANNVKCKNNLKQMGLAVQTYIGDHGYFPSDGPFLTQTTAAGGNYCPSTFVALLPYLEQNALYQAYQTFGQNPSFARWPDFPIPTALSVFACPSDAGNPFPALINTNDFGTIVPAAVASYRYTDDTFGVIAYCQLNMPEYNSITILDVVDGTSNTILFGEYSNYDPHMAALDALMSANGWGWDIIPLNTNSLWSTGMYSADATVPLNYSVPVFSTFDLWTVLGARSPRWSSFGSGHSNGANFVFCDGSVHFINNSINNTATALNALCTRAGGEVVDFSQYGN